MNKQTIVNRLIFLYEKAIPEVKSQTDLYDMLECCIAFGVQQGVCTAMARHLAKNSEQMRENWLLMADTFTSYADFGTPFWGETPQFAKTKEQLISYLEYRLNLLHDIATSFQQS